MTAHAAHGDVPYKEQKVDPPADLGWHADAGALVFTGTCPTCRGWNEFLLVNLTPGTVAKGLPWRRKTSEDEDRQRRMACACPVTHPDADELPGCGAWWTVRIPSDEAS